MRWFFEARVNAWREKIRTHQVLPPITVGYAGGCFEVNCNSPLFEALLREKIEYFPVVVWSTKESEGVCGSGRDRPLAAALFA